MERRLHRGLEALMGSANKQEVAATTQNQTLQSIPVDSIRTNPRQPRRHFDPGRLQELVDSIRSQGLLQPVVVRRVDVGYELIAGERRWRACKTLGMDRISAIVRSVEEDQQLVLALVENVQRADLNAIEEGMAIRRLLDEFGLTHDEVAKRLGKERSTVSNTLRLIDLPADAKDAVAHGTISAGHGRALLPIADTPQFPSAFQKVVSNGLSVRETEGLVKQLQQASAPASTVTDADTPTAEPDALAVDFENRLRATYGVKTSVKLGKRGGVVSFHCMHRRELNFLLERLLEVSDEQGDGDDEFHV